MVQNHDFPSLIISPTQGLSLPYFGALRHRLLKVLPERTPGETYGK